MKFAVTMLLLLCLSAPAAAQNVEDIASFDVEGIGLNVSLADVKAMRGAERVAAECDSALGLESYVVTGLKSADGVAITFLDEHIITLHALYYAKRVNNNGGIGVLLGK
jgi:hypothetical protein